MPITGEIDSLVEPVRRFGLGHSCLDNAITLLNILGTKDEECKRQIIQSKHM